VLVATGTGIIMVPGRLHVLAKMLTPHRFRDPEYAASIAGDLYGGAARDHGVDVAKLFHRQLHAPSKMGYLHQLLAGSVWTSLFALPAIRQPALVMAGTDDPVIRVVNAHIMTRLLTACGVVVAPRRAHRPGRQRQGAGTGDRIIFAGHRRTTIGHDRKAHQPLTGV
jgi:pimeloyl-ACP methyl ester carboxylesterase